MQRIQRRFGMEGIGIYWCLVEAMYAEDGALPFDGIEDLAYGLRVDPETIRKMAEDTEIFGNNGSVFWSNRILSELEARQESSEKYRKNALARWAEKDKKESKNIQKKDDKMQLQCNSNAVAFSNNAQTDRQTIQTESNTPPLIPPKGGEPPKSRGKNNKVTDQETDDIISTIAEKDYQDSLKLFVVHRREIRKPMTANALKQTIKLLEQIPKVDDRIKCVELSIANGWQGVFPDKFTETQPTRQQKTRTSPEPDLKGDDSWKRKVRNHGKQD